MFIFAFTIRGGVIRVTIGRLVATLFLITFSIRFKFAINLQHHIILPVAIRLRILRCRILLLDLNLLPVSWLRLHLAAVPPLLLAITIAGDRLRGLHGLLNYGVAASIVASWCLLATLSRRHHPLNVLWSCLLPLLLLGSWSRWRYCLLLLRSRLSLVQFERLCATSLVRGQGQSRLAEALMAHVWSVWTFWLSGDITGAMRSVPHLCRRHGWWWRGYSWGWFAYNTLFLLTWHLDTWLLNRFLFGRTDFLLFKR